MSLISAIPGSGFYGPRRGRFVTRLTDGSMMAVYPNNDSDGNAGMHDTYKFYYTSADQLTVTALKATIDIGTGNGGGDQMCSIASDSLNNIHFVYRPNPNNDNLVNYVKLTKSGTTWTVGTPIALPLNSDGRVCVTADIDVTGSDNVVIIGHFISTLNPSAQETIRMWTVTGATTAVITHEWTHMANAVDASPGAYTVEDCSLSVLHTANETSNVATACIAVTNGANAANPADQFKILRFNAVTGAYISDTIYSTAATYTGVGARKVQTFASPSDNRSFVICGIDTADDNTAWVMRVKVAVGGALTTTTPLSIYRWNDPGVVVAKNDAYDSWCAFAMANAFGEDRLTMLVLSKPSPGVGMVNTFQWNLPATIGTSALVITPYARATQFQDITDAVWQVFSGNQRNYTITALDYIVQYRGGNPTYAMHLYVLNLPETPDTVFPPASSTQRTNEILFSARFATAYNYSQLGQRIFWEVASNVGFTTGYQSFLSNDFLRPSTVSGAEQTKLAGSVGTLKLASGTWYVRASVIDAYGSQSAYSPVQSFVISHPPSAITPSPTGNTIVSWGTGVVQFGWGFSDPYSNDVQTAYQIIVEQSTDNVNWTTSVDTGTVVSSAKVGSVTLPVGAKDKYLRWKIRLRDGDNIFGAYTTNQYFVASDLPVPVISSPADAGTVTVGNPTIAWASGMGGTKVQVKYQVRILQGTTVIYDSGVLLGANTSLTIPTGYLRNTTVYSVRVDVWDTFNLNGSDTNLFTTAFTAPTAPSWVNVFAKTLDSYGYVLVGWSGANRDSNFSAWNLYRRVRGQIAWDLISIKYDNRAVYSFIDYTAKQNQVYEYAVSQVKSVNGDKIESNLTSSGQVTTSGTNYWLIDSTGVLDPVKLYLVKDHQFTDEKESATYTVIGRGRHVDNGQDLGQSGTLTCQLYDVDYGGIARVNPIRNPNLLDQVEGASIPEWAFTATVPGNFGGFSSVQTKAVTPTGLVNGTRIFSDNFTTPSTDFVQIQQDRIMSSDFIYQSGGAFSISMWVSNNFGGALYSNPTPRIWVSVEYLNAANTVLGDTINTVASVIDTFVSTPDNASGSASTFYRMSAAFTQPAIAGFDHLRVTIKLRPDASTSDLDLMVFGILLDQRSGTPLPFFSGDDPWADWRADRLSSASYTSGFHTARDQRIAVEDTRDTDAPLYLKTPFGDVIPISLGNLAMARYSGMGGQSDAGELTVPYTEVAF
jgi:hypothetical protein